MEPNEQAPEEQTPVAAGGQIPTLAQAQQAVQPVVVTNNFNYQRLPEYTIGTPENKAFLEASKSDPLMWTNAVAAIQRRNIYLNSFRTAITPAGYEAVSALTSLGNTPDEIITNLRFEQERTDDEADFYFNLIRPELEKASDSGLIKPATLTVEEIATLIRSKGGLQNEDDYRRFLDTSRNTTHAKEFGISSAIKISDKVRRLDKVFTDGEKLDAEFQAGKFTWDPSNEEHRRLFRETWAPFTSQRAVDGAMNIGVGFASVFTQFADLAAQVIGGVIAPEEHISEEFRSNPEKFKRVMDTLTKLKGVNERVKGILGLQDRRSITETIQGVPRSTPLNIVLPSAVQQELMNDPEYAAALRELSLLDQEGAFTSSRMRTFSSVADGAYQGLIGLASIPFGGGMNPGGYWAQTVSAVVNAHNIGWGDFDEEQLRTKMKWANLSRDINITLDDWMNNGALVPRSAYSKTQGGFGGQALDVTGPIGRGMKVVRSMRHGVTASQRVATAERVASRVRQIENLAVDAIPDQAINDTVNTVMQTSGLTRTEAIEGLISGRITIGGRALSGSDLDNFINGVQGWADGLLEAETKIDRILQKLRDMAPNGAALTAEQVMEYYAQDTLPTGAGRKLFDVVDALDPGVRKALFARLAKAGPMGQRILENIQKASPDRGALYGAWRFMGGRMVAGAAAGTVIGTSMNFDAGISAIFGGIASGATTWMYLVPDFLQTVGYIGNKGELITEYMARSADGQTFGGSVWLKMWRDKMEQARALEAKAAGDLRLFPDQAKAALDEAERLKEQARGAKTMHYFVGPESSVTTFFGPLGDNLYGATLQDAAFALMNEDLAGYGFGGSIGSSMWNKAYTTFWKRGVLNNKDRDFARNLIELRDAYADRPDHQRAAVIRVLDRAEKEGNVREIVAALVHSRLKGVETVIMPGHQADAAIQLVQNGIIGPDGRRDMGATIDSLVAHGLTPEEAAAYAKNLQVVDETSATMRAAVEKLSKEADELTMKADRRAEQALVNTEKLNAAELAYTETKAIVDTKTEALRLAKEKYDAEARTGVISDDTKSKLRQAEDELRDANKRMRSELSVADSLRRSIDRHTQDIRQMRADADARRAQSLELSKQIKDESVPIGSVITDRDGNVGRKIHGGAYVFDKPNGRRYIILAEETFTRADVLEEVYHALDDDAVIQSMRPDAVSILYGIWGKDENGAPVLIDPPKMNPDDVDRWMENYAQGLPDGVDKTAWMENYRTAKKHYENTGDPAILFRHVSEVMARRYVARQLEIGLYGTRRETTPSTPGGGLEGSASPGTGGTGGVVTTLTDIGKVVFGELTLADYARYQFRNGAEAAGIIGRGGLLDSLFNAHKIDYLRRSGVTDMDDPRLMMNQKADWRDGFMFDENGNRVRVPYLDSYISKFLRRMRGEIGVPAIPNPQTLAELEALGPEQQVAWATKNNKRHWLVERRDGQTQRLKPIAQIMAEYNKANDAIFLAASDAITKHGAKIGMRLETDADGVQTLFGTPTEFGVAEINRLIRASELPVSEKRMVLEVLAGIAGSDVGNPNSAHPGMVPVYSVIYTPVTSDGLPNEGARKTKSYAFYGIEIRRSTLDKNGEKLPVPRTNLYLRSIDLDNANDAINRAWNGTLVDENGIQLFTKDQVSEIFNNRQDIANHLYLYLSHLSGSKDPVLSAGGAEVSNSSSMSRSWEIFDVSGGTDPESVARAKFIAEVMYRIVGTRPTEAMRFLMGEEVDADVRPTQADRNRARLLERNAGDMKVDVSRRTARLSDMDPYDEDGFWIEGAKPQKGIFRKIRIDRIDSLVNQRNLNPDRKVLTRKGAMMPFTSQAYLHSQVGWASKYSWRQVDEPEMLTTQHYPGAWWNQANPDFKKALSGKITEAYAHESGYLVYKTRTGKNWVVANTITGEIVSQGVANPSDAFALANKHALNTPQRAADGPEQQLLQRGFFPRGLATRGNSLRGLYQSAGGYTLEAKSAGGKRYILRDPSGNIVSDNLLLSVNANVLDDRHLDAALTQARTNARFTKELSKGAPAVEPGFLDFYDVSLGVDEAKGRGVVAAQNPVYYNAKEALNRTLGPANTNMILGLMQEELGYETLHDNRKAVADWLSDFFTRRVNEDMRGRIKENFPKPGEIEAMSDPAKKVAGYLMSLEEVSLLSSQDPNRPNRTPILDQVMPQVREGYERRQQEIRDQDVAAKQTATEARRLKLEADRRDREAQAARKQAEALQRKNDAQSKAEAALLQKRADLLEKLAAEDRNTARSIYSKYISLFEGELKPDDWRGKDSLFRKAVEEVNKSRRERGMQERQVFGQLEKWMKGEERQREAVRSAFEAEQAEFRDIDDKLAWTSEVADVFARLAKERDDAMFEAYRANYERTRQARKLAEQAEGKKIEAERIEAERQRRKLTAEEEKKAREARREQARLDAEAQRKLKEAQREKEELVKEWSKRDGVYDQLIAEAEQTGDEFEAALLQAGIQLQGIKTEVEAGASTAVDIADLQRKATARAAMGAATGTRKKGTATVNRVLGNELGWKIVEVYVNDTNPDFDAYTQQSGKGIAMARALLRNAGDILLQRGTEVNLQPTIQPLPREFTTTQLLSEYGGPEAKRSIPAAVGDYVKGLAKASVGAVRVRYLVYNPSGQLISERESEREALEEAALVHTKDRKKK